MNPFEGKRIMVTGGAGFLGSHVVRLLRETGCADIIVPRRHTHDLRNQQAAFSLVQATQPAIIIHLAAAVGGIEANRRHPGSFFYDNLVMGVHLMEAARQEHVEKFVTCGTICAYPKHASVPFREEELWMGYPEETNAPYGLAKKMLLVQSQAYRKQYGFRGIYLLPVNLYGPGDNFDPVTSHVIPALIRKCIEAKESGRTFITVWGSGAATREFLYVEDAAEAIVRATALYDGEEPVNIGSGEEITIRDLARLIADLTGFTGEIRWDRSKPDGQPRRCLDVTKARELFQFTAKTSLIDGLKKTIAWYLQNERGREQE